MKASQSYRLFPGLLRTSRHASRNEQPKLKRLRNVFAMTLKRLLGTGERLRATLGEPD
jgi:hypothetical protein